MRFAVDQEICEVFTCRLAFVEDGEWDLAMMLFRGGG